MSPLQPSPNLLRSLCALLILWASISALQDPPNPNQRCPGHSDKGPCNRNLYKWYYDAERRQCRIFLWGGCAGNDKNRFDTEVQCMRQCTLRPKIDIENKTNPVPKKKRGPQLTFQETGHQNTFMFAQSNTFIQIDGDIIQTFQLRLCRQISFKFRTRLPHGLLVYHNVKVPAGVSLQPYALYVIVQQGQLKVVHVYGKDSTALTVGWGLNRDEWHFVTVRIDVHGARLMATVDNLKDETYLQGLDKEDNYGVSANVTSVILIGGLSSEERLHGVKYIIESFVGCIEDVVLSSGKSASDLDMLPISPLIATKHENVQEGCVNKCDTMENLCFQGSRCINHYNGLGCDCFGTPYEGEYCDIFTATVLTLRGSAYVSYRVYDWKDRVHSAMNRFSMVFRTQFDDSTLFYASGGEHELDHYIAASIVNNSVYIEVNFGLGDNTMLSALLGQGAHLKEWNNLTIFHEDRLLHLVLNEERVVLNVTGSNRLLYIDPEIYIGGGPELTKKIGLKSSNNYAGCLKYVFYNDISIIYELQKMNPKVHYIGILRPEFYEADVSVIPMTFPFLASHIWWPNNNTDTLSLVLDFKSSTNLSVIASSETQTGLYWEVRVVNDEVRFELADSVRNTTQLISVKKIPGIWHTMTLKYGDGDIFLSVDSKYKQEKIGELKFAIGDRIKIGSGSRSNAGLVGCMRDIELNGEKLEPRRILQMERVFEVTLDDCRFVDPCKRPNTCEHGGLCSVKEDKLTCNCDNTGYTGMNCHFTKYRKTCEELALLGYTKPDVYLIDIDGNGRFPPAHVRCEFQSLEDSTKTIVEHNLPSQMDVRSPSETDFSFSIKYREFTADMLQELVSHSLNCSQYIRYDCLKAPLDLHSNTWFISSANETVDYIGDVKRGTCPCSVDKQCEKNTIWCNCDYVNATVDKWMADNGSYTKVSSLGITEMFFLQQPDLTEEALGRITLGPLECVETNTQKYVVTFTTSQSYIEVPGWRKGDLAFSFRTTGRKAILLYQPPIRPNYPSFMVALTSDFQLTFNFTLNTGVSKEIMIVSARRLNAGEWHKIWIDYNRYHVRFMINEDQAMVNLNPEEEFGPFEGSMFIGGAADSYQHKSSVTYGLIGCFRGLVVNEEILDIYSYMSVHLSEIIKDCKPSCVPNPCKNGAQCRELWSTFECICPNPWAYNGTTCEYNINTKGVTFTIPDSYIRRNYLGTQNSEEKIILKRLFSASPILFNIRTYDQDAFILYANDHLNNFAHIYIQDGHTLVYQFNHGRHIHNISVECAQLNSSESVQVAIVRENGLGPGENISITTVHVNNENKSLHLGVKLLDEYWSKPWRNAEIEILAPPRPPAPPTDYFQINVGGFDTETLLKVSDTPKHLNGYVGCLRGFQIGDTLIDLPAKVQSFDGGVLPICNMSCDALPCKHGGLCIEHFAQAAVGGHSCDCEHTSYYGEHCADDKGAEFSGESNLWREFPLDGGAIRKIKVQMAFSSMDVRKTDSVLMLLQTENDRSYYFLVRITHEGHLVVEEDREELGLYSATVYSKTFVNGARHSIYYKRQCVIVNITASTSTTTQATPGSAIVGSEVGDDPLLMIDEMLLDPEVLVHGGISRSAVNDSLLLGCIGENVVTEELLMVDGGKVDMVPINRVQYKLVPHEGTGNEVQIGGHRTSSDPRFMTYKWYSGCLSNILIEINEHSMKPLEEYMLFTKTGLEKVNVSNPQGVRSAQCSAQFDTQHKTHNGPPNLNITQGKDKTWVQDAPQRIPYTHRYTISAVVEDDRGEIAVIILASLFIVVLICVSYEVYRSDKAYRKRKERLTDVNIMWSKEHAAKMQEPTNTLDILQLKCHKINSSYIFAIVSNNVKECEPGDALKSLQNGKSVKLSNGNISINGNTIPEIDLISLTEVDNIQKPEKRISFKENIPGNVEENNLDKPIEKIELLSPMLEEDEENLDEDSDDLDKDLDINSQEDNEDTEATEELISTINGSVRDQLDDIRLSIERSAQILRNMGRNSFKQVFLAPSHRKFGNPISYLGGPSLPYRNRSSIESVLSLD